MDSDRDKKKFSRVLTIDHIKANFSTLTPFLPTNTMSRRKYCLSSFKMMDIDAQRPFYTLLNFAPADVIVFMDSLFILKLNVKNLGHFSY